MLWTSSGAVGVVQRCLTRLLGLPGTGIVRGRLRNIRIAAALTMLIVLLVLVASAGTGIVHRLHVDSLVLRLAVPLLSIVITVLICAVVYRSQTASQVGWRAALSGGAVGGLVLQATPTAAGYYLRLVAGHTPVQLFLMPRRRVDDLLPRRVRLAARSRRDRARTARPSVGAAPLRLVPRARSLTGVRCTPPPPQTAGVGGTFRSEEAADVRSTDHRPVTRPRVGRRAA